MTALLGVAIRALTVVAICCALFVVVVWLAGGPDQTRTTTSTFSPATVTALPTAAPTMPAGDAVASPQQAAGAQKTGQAAAPTAQQPMSVTLSEAEVNAMVIPELTQQPDFPLEQPYITITPNQFTLNGQAALGPTTVPVSVAGTVVVQNGIPALKVERVTAMGVAAPPSLVAQVDQSLNGAVRLTPANLPLVVQSVSLGSHQVTISGVSAKEGVRSAAES